MQQLNADARQGRNLSGITGAGEALSFQPHPTATLAARQVESPRLTALLSAWQLARAEGDREGAWLARRLYLLGKARLYHAGEVTP